MVKSMLLSIMDVTVVLQSNSFYIYTYLDLHNVFLCLHHIILLIIVFS
jgi:hypothetical protein